MDKVVIFDVDGTLFDTKAGIIKTFNYVLERFDKNEITENEESRFIGPSVRQSFINLVGLDEKDAEIATRMYRKIYVEKFVTSAILYDGVDETLQTLLNKGFKLCIATMKTASQVKALLANLLDESYFEIIKTAKEDGSLSKEQMLLEIRGLYGDSVQYYMVGDTIGDYNASVKAKMDFVAALYGYGELEKDEYVYYVNDFREISEII